MQNPKQSEISCIDESRVDDGQMNLMDIEIIRKPVLYYREVLCMRTDGTRFLCTTAVSMWTDGRFPAIDYTEHPRGDKVLASVEAQPGNFEVGYFDAFSRWCVLGYETPGAENVDWMQIAIEDEGEYVNVE